MIDSTDGPRKRVLNLNEEKNPEYHAVVNEYNRLIENWKQINRGLTQETQPKIFLCRRKQYLIRKYGKPIKELQGRFIDWNKRASNIVYNPNLTFGEDEESELGLLHYIRVMQDLKNNMENRMI